MFDSRSRYHGLRTATLELRDGRGATREVRYVTRRFIPPPATDEETVAEHIVVDGDRLDALAARYLDDPLQFWRLCDANRAMHPLELTDDPGATLGVALPRL
jgi:hypothetical protein